jgi:hypothetical protein
MARASYTPDLRGYQEIVVRDADGSLRAIITHPCVGAKWFLLWKHSPSCRGKKYPSKQAALDAAAGPDPYTTAT